MFRHVSLIVVSTAVYGLALGWWRSVEMALYVAAKLPVVFVGSTLVVSAFAWMAGLVVGAGLRYRAVLGLVFAAMASASRLLLAFMLVIVAVALGARTLGGAVKAQAVNTTTGLSAWFVVFLVVALQAITLVRPMLSPIGTERAPEGKCFFVSHFFRSLETGVVR